ncbi:SusC/RagA family TonB-linked outer membrane protein [Chitinophaga barathri]|uniref:TonB-dependent receptor n=1 Tax=Chitinophaga barathri TaxID=1647451 RepID=A0A3N4M4B5_9BACT|nr:TonB-dependent receptor [Chitinophaga barathri]RPD37894.1 TonB-dependent receptor [Chitinophaga barathri]
MQIPTNRLLRNRIKKRLWLRYVTMFLFISQPLILAAQEHTVPLINSRLSGRVVDAVSREALPGAIVQIKGTTHGVSTDEQGKFGFVTGQKFPYTLIVSFLGYKKQEVIAETGQVEIRLEPVQNQLNDVVVVGYGTQKKSDLTGSISSVSGNLLKQPVSSLDQALKGSVPGIQVTQTSGQPGGGVSIRIRGGSSIQGGNEPLYVIDGFPVYNNPVSAGILSGTPVNPLANINPSDIESIDVLKDASATAIYGSRGANGVVIITTKKGKADKSALSYEVLYGVQSLRKKIAVLGAKDFAVLRNEVLYDANPSRGKNQYLTQAQIDQLGRGTDWQDEAFRSAPQQSHQLTISGGSAKTRYLLSGNYFNQQGIIRNTDFSRFSIRANVDANPFDRLKVSAALTASKSDANVAPAGIVSSLLIMPPTATVYEPDGSYTLRNPFENIFANPVATINEQINKSITNRFFGTAFAEYKILEGLQVKVLFGADVNTTNEKSYIPSTIYEGAQTNGSAGQGTYSSYSWLNENTVSYAKSFGKHNFDALAGFTQQEYTSDVSRSGAQNFVTNDLTYNNLQSGATLVRPYSDATAWVLHSWLARVNYNYANRYYFTASIRTDGSSRFGKGNKWGYFPSAAASWRVSNEPFFRALSKTISDLKIRASFGTTGNLEIGEYQSLAALYSLTYLFGGKTFTGFAPSRIPNDKLGWETTYQYNAGIDVGLFNNRLQVSLDGYYKKTQDLLLSVEIPWTTGQNASLQNFGSVQNKGFEIGVNSRNLTGALGWNTNLSFSLNRNKVLTLGNGARSYITGNYIIRVGEPLGSFYGTVTDGILQPGEEAGKGQYTGSATPKPGDRLYKDISGDKLFTTAADRTIIGNAQPDFIFGLNNTFDWKGLSLSVFLQGSYGNKILNSNRQQLELFTGQQNAAASALDRWTPEHTNTQIPRAKLDPAPVFSDRFIEDGSFLRVKNIALGYSLPRSVFRNIASVEVYVSAQNLLTWTNYTGFDPEVTSGSNVSPGTDSGIYPVSRTVSAGAKISF